MQDTRPSPDDAAFLERVMRYLEDTLDPVETSVLSAELEQDARKRETFAQICLSDTLAHEELPALMAGNPAIDEHPEKPVSESMHESMVLPALSLGIIQEVETKAVDIAPAAEPTAPPKPAWPWRTIGGLAAVLLLGITATVLMFALRQSPAVATFSAAVDTQWKPDSSPAAVGSSVTVGQLFDLQAGYANLSFSDGTQVVMEGPARLKLSTRTSVELTSGRISVKLIHGRSGFVVITPQTTVTDLGTEFGVSVDPISKTTEVHVFVGRVAVNATGSGLPAQTVVGGQVAHVSAGTITVIPGASAPQQFVRDMANSSSSLEIADLLSAGDGSTHCRGGVIDPVNGTHGLWGDLTPWYQTTDPADSTRSDGEFHRVKDLPILNGCFVVNATGSPMPVDSAGDTYRFPVTSGECAMRVCVGGSAAPRIPGDAIAPVLLGINYCTADHSYVVISSNAGITFDLAELRRLHPAARLAKFRCTFGHYDAAVGAALGKTDLQVLVDGKERFAKRKFTFKDGATPIDLPLTDSDRFVTIACTDGGDGMVGDDILLGDAVFDLVGK